MAIKANISKYFVLQLYKAVHKRVYVLFYMQLARLCYWKHAHKSHVCLYCLLHTVFSSTRDLSVKMKHYKHHSAS